MEYLAPIENRFSALKVISYAKESWHYSFYISAIYVVSVFTLRRYMQDRERYNLRVPLFMWSLTLAVFSIMGSVSLGIPLLSYYFSRGWERSVCDSVLVWGQRGLWSFLFCFSKFPELVDTYFVVLRKQKLIFLHWYHHVTVFIYCWYHYAVQIRPAQWFIVLNYFVHAVMYSYYALRASGRVRPPIWVNMIITVLQILQMVFGVYINFFIYNKMGMDSNWLCDGVVETSYFYVYCSFAMYSSYFLLFAHFFWSSYFGKSANMKKGMMSDKLGTTIPETATDPVHYSNGHIRSRALKYNGVTVRHCDTAKLRI